MILWVTVSYACVSVVIFECHFDIEFRRPEPVRLRLFDAAKPACVPHPAALPRAFCRLRCVMDGCVLPFSMGPLPNFLDFVSSPTVSPPYRSRGSSPGLWPIPVSAQVGRAELAEASGRAGRTPRWAYRMAERRLTRVPIPS